MRRVMRKFWKEFTYLVGLFVLGFAHEVGFDLQVIGVLYSGFGLAWLVVRLLRRNDGHRIGVSDMTDSRGLHGGYSSYNHRH